MGDLGKANILCFHGYMQNAELFRSRIGSIRKALKSKAEFHFLNAPFLADLNTFENGSSDDDRGEGRSWFQWQDVDLGTRPSRATKYSGWETSKQLMLEQFQSRPVHGMIGFSQGATNLGMFLSQGVEEGWLEKVAPDLKFVVLIAGFAPKDESFLEIIQRANICIPSLHVYGETDELVSNDRTLQLSQCFKADMKQVFVHSGGHMVPTCSGQFKQILLNFVSGNETGAHSSSST